MGRYQAIVCLHRLVFMMNAEPIKKSHSMKLPYLVAATFFMEYLDTTIIATALPQMAESFGVGPNEVGPRISLASFLERRTCEVKNVQFGEDPFCQASP